MPTLSTPHAPLPPPLFFTNSFVPHSEPRFRARLHQLLPLEPTTSTPPTTTIRSLPNVFGGLRSLVNLDLSLNKLGGPLPRSLGELGALKHLNLAANNFT